MRAGVADGECGFFSWFAGDGGVLMFEPGG